MRADGDVPAASAALGALFCEEEDVRRRPALAAAVPVEEEKKDKKGKGKK